MIRRVPVSLAAFAVGMVALEPVGEVVFYGLEAFPVGADGKGVLRIVSATGAIILLLVGVAAGAAVRGRARGWPVVAVGLLVAGLLAAYAPLDVDSAFGELHPLVRPVAAIVGGIVLGGLAVALLPASPAGGDPWPVAAFAAGVLVTVTRVPEFLPGLPELRQLGWSDVVALLLATLAAIAVRPAGEARAPGIAAVAKVALLGALVGAAFHMEYVGRSTTSSPAAVVVLVLLLSLAVWVGLTWVLVGWSGRVAGADAARFALTCAGATGVLFTAGGGSLGTMYPTDWIPLLGLAAAIAGVLLTRLRPAVPWDAAGLAVAAVVTLVGVTVETIVVPLAAVGTAAAAFTLGAALARTATAGAICGLLSVVLTLPVLIGVVTQLDHLVTEEGAERQGTLSLVVVYAPVWLVGLATAALLVGRPRPASTTPALSVG
jgi:hypothetical protein